MIPTPEIGWSNLLKLYRNGLQVQGDMMRHHLVNVSSRQYNPASKQMRNSLPPNVFTGGTSWSKGHNRFLSVPRKYSQSAVVRRESVRDWVSGKHLMNTRSLTSWLPLREKRAWKDIFACSCLCIHVVFACSFLIDLQDSVTATVCHESLVSSSFTCI